MQQAGKVTRNWRALGILPLGTGAALVAHALTNVSLGLALLFVGAFVCVVSAVAWRHLPLTARHELVRRVRAGAIAGLPAVAAYDGIRWTLVTVFHMDFWPFDIFSIFGQAIAGQGTATGLATALGVLYHVTNALCFAIAYAIIFAPRGWWAGLLWALGLEAMMLAIYPGWLHPKAFEEFVSVSMLGHVAYGLVLGIVSRRIISRQRPRKPPIPAISKRD